MWVNYDELADPNSTIRYYANIYFQRLASNPYPSRRPFYHSACAGCKQVGPVCCEDVFVGRSDSKSYININIRGGAWSRGDNGDNLFELCCYLSQLAKLNLLLIPTGEGILLDIIS